MRIVHRRGGRSFTGSGLDPKYTLDAAAHLASFDKPVLIAWSADDRFSLRSTPSARLEWIEDARTFSPEDQPERLAELISAFVRMPAAAA